MGRAENLQQRIEYRTKVRFVNGLTIYFANKQAIYVTDGKVAIVLERWFEGNNFYKESWRKLTSVLVENKSLATVYQVWNVAMRYNVQAHQTFHFPEIKKDSINITEANNAK